MEEPREYANPGQVLLEYYEDEPPDLSSNTPPIPYGRDWPGQDSWLDPADRSIHPRP